MKLYKFLFSIIAIITLASCNHSSEPLYIQKQFTQLKTVIAPWEKDNDLLPWNGQYHCDIINSVADVYATQTERFIEENPNWLRVDFSKKSIITVRTILFAYNFWQYTDVKSFSQYMGEDDSYIYIKKGDYKLYYEDYYEHYDADIDDDKSQYRICQIAIVTDKIPSDASVVLSPGTNH